MKRRKTKNRFFGAKNFKIPDVIAHVEPNEKFGCGYQVRFTVDGKLFQLQDEIPYSLDKAIEGATIAFNEANKRAPINYNPKECIKISRIAGDADD